MTRPTAYLAPADAAKPHRLSASLRLLDKRAPVFATPASAGAASEQGNIWFDGDFLYGCVAENTWLQIPWAPFGSAGIATPDTDDSHWLSIVAGSNLSADRELSIVTGDTDRVLDLTGPLHLIEQNADPADPAEGRAVIWQSDGTGAGDDGDVLVKVTAGGVTKTATLVDFSAI